MAAHLQNTYMGVVEAMVADHVVIEAGSTPNMLLYDALWRVGDAVAHRGIHDAILDSRRLCQNL